MSRRAPGSSAVAALLVLLLAAGCSSGAKPKDLEVTTTVPGGRPVLLCDLISIPLETMINDGTTFSELVADRSGDVDAEGLDAMVALALMARGTDEAGRFEPVLRYLAERSTAASDEQPRLTDAIKRNARELDVELAKEGCP